MIVEKTSMHVKVVNKSISIIYKNFLGLVVLSNENAND